jgi:hypothetical protein
LIDQSIDANSLCEVISSTLWDVTCKCLVPIDPRRRKKKRRRLVGNGDISDNDAVDNVLYESGAVTMGMMVYYVAKDFKNTFKAAPNALSSSEDTEKVLIVILLYSGLWSIGLFCMGFLGFKQYYTRTNKMKKLLNQIEIDRSKEPHQSQDINGRHRHRRSNQLGGRSSGAHDMHSQMDTEKMRIKLSDYVKSVIPSVFNTTSAFTCMKNEILRHHAYLRLMSHNVTERLPTLSMAQLLTTQTILMFLLAVLYDVQGPEDDGTCGNFVDQSACEKRRSLFDSDQSYCLWQNTPTDGAASCVYHQINFTYQVSLYCAVIASVFSALVLRPVHYLFGILNSPTAASVEAALALSKTFMQKDFPSTGALAGMIRRASISVQNAARKAGDQIQTMLKLKSARFIPEDTQVAYRHARLSMTILLEGVNQTTSHDTNDEKDDHLEKNDVFHGKVEDLRLVENLSNGIGPTASEFDNKIQKLKEDLHQTRKLIAHHYGNSSTVLLEFDQAWGMNGIDRSFVSLRHGRTTRIFPRHYYPSHTIMPNEEFDEHTMTSLDIMKTEMQFVSTVSANFVKELTACPDDRAGVEILQLFIQDLLGRDTAAAKIFRAKADEDYAPCRLSKHGKRS